MKTFSYPKTGRTLGAAIASAPAEQSEFSQRMGFKPKRKTKDVIYRFRYAYPDEPVADFALNLRCEKWSRGPREGSRLPYPSELQNTYHIWGNSESDLLCDCPGAMYHADKEGAMHKHTIWAREWYELITLGGMSGVDMFYDPEEERFREALPDDSPQHQTVG